MKSCLERQKHGKQSIYKFKKGNKQKPTEDD